MHSNFNIKINDLTGFLETLKKQKIVKIDEEDFWTLGFDALPFEKQDLPTNFPDCCEYHREIVSGVKSWFLKFPNCCEVHESLLNRDWFNKGLYKNIPQKILRQLSYTENFISLNIEKENWYKEITDYIDYNIESFGTPNIGVNKYMSYLEHWISKAEPKKFEFHKWKRKQLIEFLKIKHDPPKKPNTDLNILSKSFQKWLKTFPNLAFFSKLKYKYTGKLPLNLMLYEPEYNRFTGLTKYKMRTKGELIEILVNTTKSLLNSLNSVNEIKKNTLSKELYQLDLINEEHRIKQSKLLSNYSKGETKYVKIIKKWLKNEKEYLSQISPILKIIESMPKEFTFETREAFGNKYIKLFVRRKEQINDIVEFITKLPSVGKANITNNKETDITIYPSKTYETGEVIEELTVALEGYFNAGSYDPIFEKNVIKLSNNGYDSVIDVIYNYGQNLEHYKDLYDKFDEEGFRNFFLPHLNTVSKKHSASGEAFNKIGKTDILIQDSDGLNVFIAECKLWKGQGALSDAINQLLDRYVTWRDEKTALIVFNKDMKKFSELIEKAIQAVQSHPLCIELVKRRQNTSISFIFRHPDDEERTIYLELMLFNCT